MVYRCRVEPGLILCTSHLLASFNLGTPPMKFNGRKSSFDVGLLRSVGKSIFYLKSVRGFGVSE